MVEEFKDETKGLKIYIEWDKKKLELLREQEIKEIKNETTRKLNMLDDEINDIFQKLDVDLTTLILKCKFFEKLYAYDFIKMERKLRILAKERINEIKRFKEDVKNNEDKLLDGETKSFKLLTDLKYEKKCIKVLESKLIKLEISPERIDKIKNSVLSS